MAYSVGDKVLKKMDLPNSKMAHKNEPDFRVEQVSSRERTYVLRRLKPTPGQRALIKAHHNQLKYQGPFKEGEANLQVKDKPAQAVITRLKLGQLTTKPNWPGQQIMHKETPPNQPNEHRERINIPTSDEVRGDMQNEAGGDHTDNLTSVGEQGVMQNEVEPSLPT